MFGTQKNATKSQSVSRFELDEAQLQTVNGGQVSHSSDGGYTHGTGGYGVHDNDLKMCYAQGSRPK